MNRDLLHSQGVKDLVRDAYRHVPATTAAVAHTWRWRTPMRSKSSHTCPAQR